MANKIKWGILGCGGIADKFAADLKYTKSGELLAVGSRSKRKAAGFAKKHHAASVYGSYEALVADPDVDVVYVATPHPFHADNALLAIQHGKHVLCEKPIAMNAKQTRRMIAAAQKNGVFLMEGMWTRCFPLIIRLRKWLDEGRIGQVLAIEADFGFPFRVSARHRILNPALGGGALLDLGIYPVSFASWAYQVQPKRIVSTVRKARTGVDDHAVISFEYADGATAALGASSIVRMKNEARIFGTQGMVILHESFHRPERITLEMEGRRPKTIQSPVTGTGMHYEAEHVHTCLKKGLPESPLMPQNESLAVMQTMDRIRKQWKLKYPNE